MHILEKIMEWTHPYDTDEDAEHEEVPQQKVANVRAERVERPERTDRYERYDRPERTERVERPRQGGKLVNIHGDQSKVVLVRPERYEEAADIAEHLREKRTVVLNLEETPKDLARRLLDFMSGAAYITEGKIKRVATNTYIITPFHVAVEGGENSDFEPTNSYF